MAMHDLFDWLSSNEALTYVIWFQSAVLLYSSYLFFKWRKFLFDLMETMDRQNKLIEWQNQRLMFQAAQGDIDYNRIDDIPPEERVALRGTLQHLIDELRRREH